MPEITAIFFDIGGVVLTNGWDHEARSRAAEPFNLDFNDFEERHRPLLHNFETGHLGLDQYLDQTVFYRPRPFGREAFKTFMFAQSKPHTETLTLLGNLARSSKYLIAALNNESLELNQSRIENFRLRDYFKIFLSSCFVGVKKPDAGIYRLALEITQRPPEECLFVDDRAPNLVPARDLGMRTIHYQSAGQLAQELHRNGITWDNHGAKQ